MQETKLNIECSRLLYHNILYIRRRGLSTATALRIFNQLRELSDEFTLVS